MRHNIKNYSGVHKMDSCIFKVWPTIKGFNTVQAIYPPDTETDPKFHIYTFEELKERGPWRIQNLGSRGSTYTTFNGLLSRLKKEYPLKF